MTKVEVAAADVEGRRPWNREPLAGRAARAPLLVGFLGTGIWEVAIMFDRSREEWRNELQSLLKTGKKVAGE